MKSIFFGLLVLILIVLGNSCYYDKADLLYGGTNAPCIDTAGTVSYSQKIIPLFRQYCYNCHSGGFPSGNIMMGSYATDKAIALNGKLFGSINHSTGFSPMPQGSSKLTSCQIAVIRKWIDTGVLNN